MSELYRSFVSGLNYGRVDKVVSLGDLKMHMVIDAHVMSGSDTEKIVGILLKDHIISKKDGKIDLTNLYDESQGRFVMKGKSGKKLKSKPGTTGKRTVKYLSPGHTQVGYATRTLDIRFKESKEDFEKRKHLRRVHGARKGAKKRSETVLPIFVDRNDAGMVSYVTSSGKDATHRTKKRAEKGRTQIIKNKLKKDSYTVEDMRALLKDDHWEEVSGNKRWMHDPRETVKEFVKYQKRKNKL